jgi:poly-beta-hydroxybutyrate-responsive repressor
MGNLSRFVEPVILYLLRKHELAYGYELAAELPKHALTDAEIEIGALYRTLRQLEKNGFVRSEWDLSAKGPARRRYALTAEGEQHLADWVRVLDHLSASMLRFVQTARA